MMTKILEINEKSLNLAKNVLLSEGCVAFPTETVYGLAANAFSDNAVKRIFEIKGRPNDNPLIVHVHVDYDITRLVSYVPTYAKLLADAFLPGPLTMVYKSRGIVSSCVSCGLDTLAIRIPSHEGAQAFLKYMDMPIAAPSANISKHVSPVSAEHVKCDLEGKIEIVLQGGKCLGGIESTVLDCTGEVPCILRSGLITKEMIESIVDECDVYTVKEGERVKSPGMKYKHYSPKCDTMLFEFEDRFKALDTLNKFIAQGISAYILCDDMVMNELKPQNVLNLGATELEIASNLYEKLREGENVAQLIIAVVPQKKDGVMVGVLNRLYKACNS